MKAFRRAQKSAAGGHHVVVSAMRFDGGREPATLIAVLVRQTGSRTESSFETIG